MTTTSEKNICPECGAIHTKFSSCQEYVNELIRWDFEDFSGVGQVHHLTVLAYNLQHPRVYSKKGLEDAIDFLKEFVTKNVSFKEHDERNRKRLSSSVRDWNIGGTPEDQGNYEQMPQWTMTVVDVFEGGLENYVDNVKKWSQSVYNSLKESNTIQ